MIKCVHPNLFPVLRVRRGGQVVGSVIVVFWLEINVNSWEVKLFKFSQVLL